MMARRTLTSLYALRENAPLSYDDLTDGVVAGNAAELLRIDTSVRSLGIEDPSARRVTPLHQHLVGCPPAATASWLHSCAATMSRAHHRWRSLIVTEGEGFAITLPQPSAADVTAIRVYRTQPNGDVLYRAYDYAGRHCLMLSLGFGPLGRQCDTRFMQQLPGGQIVRYWRGHVLVARGRNLLWSESMRYGAWTPTDNFVQFPHRIRVLQPVEGGVFVGTQEGVFFLVRPDAGRVGRSGALAASPWSRARASRSRQPARW
jgi:hypothetical protein